MSLVPAAKAPAPARLYVYSAAAQVELTVYLLTVLYLAGFFFLRGMQFSNDLWHLTALPGLRPGWLLGRQVDLSDYQWREFRKSLPLLAAAMAGIVAVSRLVQAYAPQQRVTYYVLVGLVYTGVLHGACSAFVLALVLANFALSKAAAGQRFGLLALWAWNCGALLLVRVYNGFSFAALSPALVLLDDYRGMARWHVHYNLVMLRLLSFAMDLHWARTQRALRTCLPADTPPNADHDLRVRGELGAGLGSFTLSSYLAYVLYPPLYLAGPILTFNQWASQLAAPARTAPGPLLRYVARACAALLCLEVAQHCLYVNAALRAGAVAHLAQWRVGRPASALEVSLLGFWVLVFIWLKFLVVWRFFRLWSLADGVECTENMTRCVCNNYDIEGFWRSWHASYNLWLVRYLYIPLGGSRTRVFNVWVVFAFVALWHDLHPRLLAWAALFALAMAPEMGAKWLARQPWFFADKLSWTFRKVCALAASANIVLLMSANLVGFVVGIDGLLPLLQRVLGDPAFATATFAAFFAAVHLMFAVRDMEAKLAAAKPRVHAC